MIPPLDPDRPWPDYPEISDPIPYDPGLYWDEEYECFENAEKLRHQRLYRWAAQSIAIAFEALPEVQKVAAFGAAALPLIDLHHCADLDLAVWLTQFDELKALKSALRFGLGEIEQAHGGYLEHYEVDVHLIDFDSGDYRGRLCNFGKCPKHPYWECRVPDCGKMKFLRQLHKYNFDRARFDAEPKVILMERASGFLVSMPLMEEPPDIEFPDYTDDDVPF